LLRGAVGLPSLSSATVTGRTFSRMVLSGEVARTFVIDTARRRGVHQVVTTLSASRKSRAFRPFAMPAAKAAPSLTSAFGGSSSVCSSTRSVWFMILLLCGLGQHREAELLARVVVGLSDQARQRAHAADVGGALGDGDRAARIQQVEAVRRLHDLLVGRQGQR